MATTALLLLSCLITTLAQTQAKDLDTFYQENSDKLAKGQLNYEYEYDGEYEDYEEEYEEEDPFLLLPARRKYHELLAADLFFNLLTKFALYSVLAALLVPAVLPFFHLLVTGAQLLIQYLP